MLYVQGANERAGAETTLLGRLRHLAAAGVDPSVASFAEGPFVDEIRDLGVQVEVLASSPPRVRQIWRLPAAVRAVLATARRLDADVIDGWGEKMSLIGGWAARIARRPAVMTLHDMARSSRGATAVQLATKSARHDAVVVPSQWMADSFRRAWGLRPQVIPNAIAFETFPTVPSPLRTDAGWDHDAPVVGVFARLVSWKGQAIFLRAAARVLERDPRARFVVAGGTLYGQEREYAEELRRTAADLGIAGMVRFTGHRTDQLELMLACDVVCHTAQRSDPSPLAVQEAMGLGRAVIATRAGGPEESIDDGRTGLLVPPQDHRALADAILRLLDDPDLRSRLARSGRQAALETHNAPRVASEVAALYRQLAGR